VVREGDYRTFIPVLVVGAQAANRVMLLFTPVRM
jgi:hypothetical protein